MCAREPKYVDVKFALMYVAAAGEASVESHFMPAVTVS